MTSMTRTAIIFCLASLFLACAETEAPAPSEAPTTTAEPTMVRAQSLRDTTPDGALNLDADGVFVLDTDARRFFDYFLTAEQEVDDADLIRWVHHEIDARLEGGAADQAKHAFARYQDYRRRAAALLTADGVQLRTPADVERDLQTIVSETFGDTSAFARAEHARVHRAFAIRNILSDTTLTPDLRDARLAELRTLAPHHLTPSDHADVEATLTPLMLHQQTQTLQRRGADIDQIQALRVDTVGPEAAARLARLDARRADWQTRLAAYQDARDQLRADHTGDALEDALEALRAQHFSGPELIRARALDSVLSR